MSPIFELNPDKTLGQCVAMEYIAVEHTHEHGTVYVCARRSLVPLIMHREGEQPIWDKNRDVFYFHTSTHVDQLTYESSFDSTWGEA